jgi:hypothetical protein
MLAVVAVALPQIARDAQAPRRHGAGRRGRGEFIFNGGVRSWLMPA